MLYFAGHAQCIISLLQDIQDNNQRLTMLQLVDKMKIKLKEIGWLWLLASYFFTMSKMNDLDIPTFIKKWNDANTYFISLCSTGQKQKINLFSFILFCKMGGLGNGNISLEVNFWKESKYILLIGAF